MKTKFFLIGFLPLLLVGCGSVIEDEANVSTEKEFIVRSELSSDTVGVVIKNIYEAYENIIFTRAVGGELALTEEQAKEYLQPFIEEGERIRDQLYEELKANPMDYPIGSAVMLSELEGPQLAQLGLVVYEFYNNPKIIAYGTPRWVNCIGNLIGVPSDFIDYLKGTKRVMTAKCLLHLVRGFSKRTLGFIGVAWGIKDYYDCMQ